MKSAITFFLLFIATISFSQIQNLNNSEPLEVIKVSDFKMSVTVNSAEDIESTFKMRDLKSALTEVSEDENISFEIVCNGDKMPNGKPSTLSYRIKGNSKDSKGFLKSVKTIRKAAINYYKNKQ